MTNRRCGRCHARGHTARHCPKNPEATLRLSMPVEAADIVWRECLYGIWRASSYDENPLRSAMVSAYLQGALDGRRPEMESALRAVQGEV